MDLEDVDKACGQTLLMNLTSPMKKEKSCCRAVHRQPLTTELVGPARI